MSEFRDFYAFYLGEHSRCATKRLHFLGTSLVLVFVVLAIVTRDGWLLAIAILQAYGWAWAGHFFYEHNRPATFKHPWLSLAADWRMWWDMLSGKIRC